MDVVKGFSSWVARIEKSIQANSLGIHRYSRHSEVSTSQLILKHLVGDPSEQVDKIIVYAVVSESVIKISTMQQIINSMSTISLQATECLQCNL